jgi:hypothetical protein
MDKQAHTAIIDGITSYFTNNKSVLSSKSILKTYTIHSQFLYIEHYFVDKAAYDKLPFT